MREYRGQRKDNGEWVKGKSYCNLAGLSYIAEYSQGEGRNVDGKIIGGWIQVSPKTVGEYTGLKDKNGKEAYYQDISRDGEGDIYVICWDAAEGVNYLRGIGPSCEDLEIRAIAEQEIVGNTKENPDLLKE